MTARVEHLASRDEVLGRYEHLFASPRDELGDFAVFTPDGFPLFEKSRWRKAQDKLTNVLEAADASVDWARVDSDSVADSFRKLPAVRGLMRTKVKNRHDLARAAFERAYWQRVLAQFGDVPEIVRGRSHAGLIDECLGLLLEKDCGFGATDLQEILEALLRFELRSVILGFVPLFGHFAQHLKEAELAEAQKGLLGEAALRLQQSSAQRRIAGMVGGGTSMVAQMHPQAVDELVPRLRALASPS